MRIDAPLLLVDFQEKLINAVHDGKKVLSNAVFLTECFKVLSKEILYTEQNPERLGRTVPELNSLLDGYAQRFEKFCFSSVCDAASGESLLRDRLKECSQIVICGVETHICVFQTAYDLLKSGYEVFVAYDACGSIKKEHHEAAVETLRSLGAVVLPSTSIVYACLESARAAQFKQILSIVKEHLK